ncbi:MAG: cobalamin-binding protein [Candidatus Omnitrophota bacterium]|nr:cobalamin-binding protein [Candidatus Omnitrophota bacterium]
MMKKASLFVSLLLLFLCISPKSLISSEVKKLRIISLAPSTTEILFSLSLDDEIVGVTTFCNYPSQALNKEKVGTFSQPDIEKILSLKPDIIFATGLEQAISVEKLKALKLNVCVSDPSNIEELFISIEAIGRLTHREKEAGVLINQMKAKIEQIVNKTKLIPQEQRQKVFVEIWHDPLMTAGKGSFVDELISLAGAINISQDIPRAYSYFSPEQVIARNPDCIILGYMSQEKPLDIVSNRLGWKEIKAVKNKRVYNDINPDLFLRPGPRLVEGLERIHNRLYPK